MDTLTQRSLSQLRWRADDYLQYFFPEGLTKENVLHFFAESPFYDKQSNNQVIRMQTQYQIGQDSRSLEQQLRQMAGIEFVVTEAHPPDLFVIQKRYRESPDVAHRIAVYFVSNDIVCQAADMYTLMASRLLNTTDALRASLQELRKIAPPFDVRQPSPPWIAPPAEDEKGSAPKDENIDLLLSRALAGAQKRAQIAAAKDVKLAVPSRAPAVSTPRSPRASSAGTPRPAHTPKPAI